MTTPPAADLALLMEALVEERITPEQLAQLESCVLRDPAARTFYFDYLELHGNLYWDAAVTEKAGDAARDEFGLESGTLDRVLEDVTSQTVNGAAASVLSGSLAKAAAPSEANFARRLTRRHFALFGGAALVASLLIAVLLFRAGAPQHGPQVVNVPTSGEPVEQPSQMEAPPSQETPTTQPAEIANRQERMPSLPSASTSNTPAEVVAAAPATSSNSRTESIAKPEGTAPEQSHSGSSEVLLSFINEQLREGWRTAGIEPSPRADDAEWLRRVYLDIAGHIPPVKELEAFLADRSEDKRERMIDRLLDDSAYVRNFASIWANLLVGRRSPPEVNREALLAFLRRQFARNVPWNETVSELIAAEGRGDQNGAVNFLVAHMNDGAIPATAITSRLFLGRQVQCTQCHNHPFNDSKQDEFWELNSFFAQATTIRHEKYDPQTGRMQLETIELAMRDVEGPVYFERRNGLMQVAYPAFAGKRVDPSAQTNRRQELARLIASHDSPMLAEALVNRMWQHFFGYAFTRQVDDIGPHSEISHPELMARLADEFARSGYDVKQLIRWICRSEAYHLTSRFSATNTDDNPEAGDLPLFSRMYVKPMSAEQLYDSLLIASQAHRAVSVNWDQEQRRRQEWLQQFVLSYDTEENDEASTFNGSIPQSLMMMNGELMDNAVSTARGTYLHTILTERTSDTEKIKKLYLSALSRYPTQAELAAVRKVLRVGRSQRGQQLALNTQAYQDIYWAFLNSNEFILNH